MGAAGIGEENDLGLPTAQEARVWGEYRSLRDGEEPR